MRTSLVIVAAMALAVILGLQAYIVLPIHRGYPTNVVRVHSKKTLTLPEPGEAANINRHPGHPPAPKAFGRTDSA